jgi:hypothetical protein
MREMESIIRKARESRIRTIFCAAAVLKENC